MGKLFNIMVCRLCLPGIYHMEIIVVDYFFMMPLNTICIKHSDNLTFSNTLIFTEIIEQFYSRTVQIILCKPFQFRPRKDNIIAIYKKIFFFDFFSFVYIGGGFIIAFGNCSSFLPEVFFPLICIIGLIKDLINLL